MPQMLSVVKPLFEKNSIPVCGVDPGIRTTGVSTSTTSAWMIQRIRYFTSNTTTELRHNIYNPWGLRASTVNHHSRSNRRRLRKERAKNAEKEGTEAENLRIGREKRTREVFIQQAYHKGIKRLREVQRRKGLVVIVNEYNTSKTCHWCLKPQQLQKYRGKDDKVRKCNGAVCCVNPNCVSVVNGCNTINRDSNASKNIALKGVAMIVSTD
ncbi:hypothetical protein EC973_002978, partial [Apophysomyces ossiformis]